MKINPEAIIHPKDNVDVDATEHKWLIKTVWNFYKKKIMSDKDIEAFVKGNSIRITDKVMPELHSALIDICDKLGIEEIPEMYVKEISGWMDVMSADHNYIIFGNEMFDNMPHEFYPTMIARECGHIMCGHVKKRTISSSILKVIQASNSGILQALSSVLFNNLNKQMAAGDLTADRAAIVYNRGTEELFEMIYRSAGAHNEEVTKEEVDEFIKQAIESDMDLSEYKGLKKLSMMGYYDMSRALLSERIVEAMKWVESDEYKSLMEEIDGAQEQ